MHIKKLLSTVQEEVREEKLLAHAVHLKLHGQCTKWCSFVWMDLSWKSILSMMKKSKKETKKHKNYHVPVMKEHLATEQKIQKI